MTDDLLKRATGALRDETSEPELRSGLTRARLLDSAAKQQKKRGPRFRWIVPFVLTFGASAALAQVTHQYFPAVWNAVMPAVLQQPAPEQEAVRKPRKAKPRTEELAVAAPAPEPTQVLEAPVVQAPAVEAPVVADPPAAPKPHEKRARAPGTVKPAVKPAPVQRDPEPVVAIKPATTPEPPAESAELSLFRRAMKLHDAKDKAAITAWDDFLRVAPKSPLATEARYNRALSLVRAGRSREAKAALTPFANGDFGGYRKREAAALLDALATRDGGVTSAAP